MASTGAQGQESIRVTATITRGQEQALRAIAADHKVSVAWLVRHAIDQLLQRPNDVQLFLDLGGER
jgi:hypothetical protein